MHKENAVTETQMKSNMDAMYRWTRHIYDASRKYYLLGRDKAIARLELAESDSFCEAGCGTARNLIKTSLHYPKNTIYGIDASDEMLKTAGRSIEKKNLQDRIQIKQGFAQSFTAKETFDIDTPFNKILFSYSLSIIPPWKESLEHALNILPSKGEIHIVDFGSCEGQPVIFRKVIFWWLKMFHVYYKPEIEAHLKTLEAQGKGTLETQQLYGGYCYLAKFTKA